MRKRPPAQRLGALFVILVLSFGGVGARLVLLQVRDARAYEAMALDQRLRRVTLPAARGSIEDRAGRELALSLPARAVYADPTMVEHPGRVATRLSAILDASRGQLRDALTADSSFSYLARRVELPVARRIARMHLPGIGFLAESIRSYPDGGLVPQVLGFVGVDDVGLAGLELQYDDELAGTPGTMVVEEDPEGHPIPQGLRRLQRPVAGQDLVTTIDRDLQFQAQRALASAVRRNGAVGGEVVVMDPATGEILALAQAPSFDGNRYDEAPDDVTRNRAVTDAYEPGSVNKVITISGALEDGIIGLRDVLDVPAKYLVGDRWFHDVEPHPTEPMTVGDIVARSSNVGTIRVAERLGAGRLDRYLHRFGFGRPTGVGFPGESDGILLPRKDWWSSSMGTIPIGQGIAVTPLQMATVYATIANHGVRVQPRLIRGTRDPAGRVHPAPEPRIHRVVSARTARSVSRLLAHAVDVGTGTAAQIPGYWVAGKTGTARKPLEGARGYSDQYVASFIGFAPATDPQVVVAAILDEPDTVYGGIAAAPLFREVARFALAKLRIAPHGRPAPPPVARAP